MARNPLKRKEIWKVIEGFPDYDISNNGRVRTRKGARPKVMVLIKQKKRKYIVINLMLDGVMKQLAVHRLVAKAFVENPNNLNVVNHKDRDRTNNNDWNLEWTTTRGNVVHSIKAVNPDKLIGVYKQSNSYVVKLVAGSRRLNLGSFKTEEEAHNIYSEGLRIFESEGEEAALAYKQSLYLRFSSKYMNVAYDKSRDKWIASVNSKDGNHLQKRFDTEEEAVEAVIETYKKIGRPLHFSHIKYLEL